MLPPKLDRQTTLTLDRTPVIRPTTLCAWALWTANLHLLDPTEPTTLMNVLMVNTQRRAEIRYSRPCGPVRPQCLLSRLVRLSIRWVQARNLVLLMARVTFREEWAKTLTFSLPLNLPIDESRVGREMHRVREVLPTELYLMTPMTHPSRSSATKLTHTVRDSCYMVGYCC